MPGLPSVDQVQNLQAQINRFGSGAPAQYQAPGVPVPVNGALDAATAAAAVGILEMRLLSSLSSFPSAATTNVSAYNAIVDAEPLAYVIANFATVLATIQLYADSLKLPAATPIVISQTVDALGGPTAALAALGGAAVLFYYLGSK